MDDIRGQLLFRERYAITRQPSGITSGDSGQKRKIGLDRKLVEFEEPWK